MSAVLDFNDAGRQGHECAPTPRMFHADVEFLRFMKECGLSVNSVEDTNSKVVRCATDDDKPGKKSGWYIFFSDGVAAGSCGNWKSDEKWSWCHKDVSRLTAQERSVFETRMEKARIAREEAQQVLAIAAAERAKENWDKAIACQSHPYLSRKGIASHGLRLLVGKLLVPMTSVDGVLHSIQEIDAEGEKRFYFGGRKKGCYCSIPGTGKVAVCEGFATAASVHEATGWTTLVAFDAGNLLPVSEVWKTAHPEDIMVICGDDDRWKDKNIGREKAEAAARTLGVVALFPQFTDVSTKPTDWNDLHAAEGLEAVKRQLAGAQTYKVKITDWQLKPDDFEVEPPPRKDLVERTLPMGAVVLLASLGGIGKSMKMLDLALKVAKKEPDQIVGLDFNEPDLFAGNRVLEHGPVVLYTAEDSAAETQGRVFRMGEKFPLHPVYTVSLIDAAGSYPFILPGGKEGPTLSSYWFEAKEQLMEIRPKLIIFDPLASFALVDLNKPEVANFAIGVFANLASETGACVLVTHHLAKSKENITTPEQARALVRGSTAIVDRTRATYVLWGVGEGKSKEICKVLGEKWERDKVIQGCLAKENFGGDKVIKTYVRRPNGLLVVRDAAIKGTSAGKHIVQEADLLTSVAEAAESAQPFTRTGANGLFTRRSELPESLKGMARKSLEALVDKLLDDKKLVLCISIGSTTKNKLDVPNGPIARAEKRIQPGSGE